MTTRFLLFVLAFTALCLPMTSVPCQADTIDDFQAWLGVNTVFWTQDQGKWNLSFWVEARFRDNVSEPLGYFAGPGAHIRAHKNLDLGLAARFILFKAEPDDLELVRYQFAVTPHFQLSRNTRLRFRNRAEWFTSKGDILRTRMRHRIRLIWPVHDMGPLVAVYASEEILYNWGEWKLNQNRFIPLGLVWKLSEHTRLSTFYMMQYIQSRSFNIHALGATAIWTLDP